jgi:hypothetical protein
VVAMSGQVQLPHARSRHAVDERAWIEAVIDGAHVDVVDVEQQVAIRELREPRQEFPFAHARGRKADVARNVLEQDAAAESVLDLPDPRSHVGERLVGIGQRQQVVQVETVDTRPAQVVRDPGGLDARGERRQLAQVLAIERVAAANRERHAVQRDRMGCADALEVMQRTAARDEIILGDRLEPVDAWSPRQDRRVMVGPESEAKAEGMLHGQRRDPGRNASVRSAGSTRTLRGQPPVSFSILALATSHSDLLSSRKPWPLHSF